QRLVDRRSMVEVS
ncbi:hypothetical protein D030_4806B, partial [Vibrio parahaemolyticus AQ3810]